MHITSAGQLGYQLSANAPPTDNAHDNEYCDKSNRACRRSGRKTMEKPSNHSLPCVNPGKNLHLTENTKEMTPTGMFGLVPKKISLIR